MLTSPEELRALQRVADLEGPLSGVEQGLLALRDALCRNDAAAIDSQASALHAALAQAVRAFAHAARSGGVPLQLRQRLAVAGAQVAAQREALARATAALDRAIDVLLPESTVQKSGVYGVGGNAARNPYSGQLLA